MHALSIMPGGPHMNVTTPSAGSNRCLRSMAWLTKPTSKDQSAPAGTLSTVYQRLKRPGCAAANASNSSRRRMSSGVWFAYTKDTCVESKGSRRIAEASCQQAEIPVPPAIKLMFRQLRGESRKVNAPFPLYSISPSGPFTSMVSPIAMDSKCCDILPPSGNRGCVPAKYTFTMKSTWPVVSSSVMGVYGRITTSPFHVALRNMCLPVGSPNRHSGEGSPKRKIRESWDTTILSTRGSR
mmetsp:Transcript_91115/g.278928  ORF Transcript_91115/g.278928 Transcript_91115/m.278928 type:complete len:239 (+) Transcript_91115:421-1137(+)